MNTRGPGRGRRLQGPGYAIGVDQIKRFVPLLSAGTAIGWTGLGLEPADPAELSRQNLPAGLLVKNAIPGTPSDKGRLRRQQDSPDHGGRRQAPGRLDPQLLRDRRRQAQGRQRGLHRDQRSRRGAAAGARPIRIDV
jgi:S1-C subfamily serine protease